MRAQFLEHAGARADQSGEPDALSAHIERAVLTAVRAWPDLALARPVFVAAMGRRFGEDRAPIDVWFQRLHADDLFLVVAVTEGVAGAAETFARRHRDELLRAVRKYEGPRQSVEDLVQGVLEKLLVGAPGKPPKLAEYAGQGPLRSWLKVVAARTAIDAVKGSAQHKREHGVDDLAKAADHSGDPELDFIKETYRASFKEAFAEAIAVLPPEERTLLRMSILRGLGIDEIGAIFHVHRATAARRVARARESLLSAVRRTLSAKLGVRDDEVDSVIGLIGSRMEVSLERLLRTTLD